MAAPMHRRHDIDTLRVLAFGLLLLYHLGMLYVAPRMIWQGLPLHSAHDALWLQYPMLLVNRWRMELLFLISGLAVHFMRPRDTPRGVIAVAGKRSKRLLLPLIFGMLVVVPVQPYVQGLAEGQLRTGFGHFLLDYWSGHAGHHGLTWAHLWYLAYLWPYTMVLLGLLPILESPRVSSLTRYLPRLSGSFLLLVPALPLCAYGLWLQPSYPENHALLGDWYAHALYATMFCYGYALGTGDRIWQELAQLRWRSLTMALRNFAWYLCLTKFADDLFGHIVLGPHVQYAAELLVVWLRYSYLWLAICSMLGWGYQWLNRPWRWLPYAREAVYPWYILHQSLLLWSASWLLPLGLGPWLEPALIGTGMLGGCAVLHEIIRRSNWLRPCFGLERRQAALTTKRLSLSLGASHGSSTLAPGAGTKGQQA